MAKSTTSAKNKAQSSEVATQSNVSQNVVVRQENGIQIADLNAGIPDLSKSTVAPMDLMGDYWTPENQGETKRLFFVRIASRKVISQQDGSLIDLDCAFFLENNGKEVVSVTNGSRRLVGALENINAQTGMAFQITYLGKKRNRTNAHASDNWSIKPLMIAVDAKVVESENAQ